jgi:hypothetical protein
MLQGKSEFVHVANMIHEKSIFLEVINQAPNQDTLNTTQNVS